MSKQLEAVYRQILVQPGECYGLADKLIADKLIAGGHIAATGADIGGLPGYKVVGNAPMSIQPGRIFTLENEELEQAILKDGRAVEYKPPKPTKPEKDGK